MRRCDWLQSFVFSAMTPASRMRYSPQLGLLGRLRFVDTLPYEEPPQASEDGLKTVTFNFGAAPVSGGPHGFNAQLSKAPHRAQKRFTEWWYSEVVGDPQNKLTRMGLVLNLSNKDGGAHVDVNRPPEYEALSRQGTLGEVSWPGAGGQWTSATGNPLYGTMRQIAYEVEQTIAPLIPPITA